MTDQQPEVPWGEPAPEQQASYERYEAANSDRYYNVPARSPEMRAEYDRQDPPAHGDYCVDSCPYDTPDQARERAERAAWAEAREAEYANAEAGQ